MGQDLPAFLRGIRPQLDARGAAPAKPLLAELEHTLTDGYAQALGLEAERLRIERRIGEMAHRLDGPDDVAELQELALRLRQADDELANLRDVLVTLQQH